MHIRKAAITSPITTLASDSTTRLIPVAGIAGIACIAGAWFISANDFARFSHAYLVNFCFFATICIGSLFFVLVQHLTRAGWSVTVRRIAEILACGILPMGLLSLPIVIPAFMGYSGLYTWVSGEMDWAANDSRIFNLKRAYLSPGFFTVRNAIYFLLWTFMAWSLYRWSVRQDETGDKSLSSRMQAFSAPMMLLFAMSLVFSSFDWEMSLAPMWFSTMFPVYFFAGSTLSALATITLISLLLQKSGRLTDEITVEHYHDLGKLMTGFIVFWGYIAFSQFMLIWYANLPEETFWFRFRTEGTWLTVSLILLFGHLFIPFLGTLGRTLRRNKTWLMITTIFLLVMHWFDHYWLVMPQLGAAIYPDYKYTTTVPFPPLPELLCFAGIGLIFVTSFCVIAGRRSLVARQDPRLHEALNYNNP